MTRLRALLALATLTAVLGGLPWVLASFGHWPISGWPTGDQIRNVGDAVVSDTAVFGVLTLAAWVVWLLFVVSFLVETGAAVRGVQAPSFAFGGPVQRAARLLVATVVVGATIHQSPPPASALPTTPARAVAAPLVEPTPSPPAPLGSASALAVVAPQPPATPPVLVTVGPGDSAWSLAEEHLGDGMRWRDLWETNRHVVQPDGRTWSDPQIIRAGWRLEIPTSGPRDAPPNGVTHVVVRGDTLSEIAAQELGDPDRYPEIVDLNVGDTQPDGRRLEDPNLILPGWELELPTEQEVDNPPETPVGPAGADSPPTPPAPADPEPVPSPAPSTAPAPTSATTSVPPTTSIPAATPNAPPAENPGVEDHGAGDAPNSEWSTAASTLAGVTGALAAGLAVRIGMLRRRRSVRGARTHPPLTEALAETGAAIVAASDVPLIRWAGQHLARLTAQLDHRDVSPGPVAVEISEASGIEVLWEAPQPNAPQPWRTADGGWAWRLPYDPDADVPKANLPSSIPALVTIGERDGRQLLLDLEAYGAVTVDGASEHVDAFLRAVAIELASSDDLTDAYVLSVGLDTAVDHLDRWTAGTADEIAATLERAAVSVGAALAAARVLGTFVARVASSVPIEATVAIAGAVDPAHTRQLIELCPARQGVAVVAAGAEGMARAHVQIGTDGVALLLPLGIEFVAAGVSGETAEAVDALLTALEAEPVLLADDVVDVRDLGRAAASPPSTNGHRPPATSDAVAPNGQCAVPRTESPEFLPEAHPEHQVPSLLVRVLGAPSVPDRPDLGRRELILTAYLACREGPVAASAVQDALWGGKPVEAKTVWNVIGATRRALGDLDDGTPVLPAADRSRSGTLQLAPGVRTDLALLRRIVEQAECVASSEAIELLREALALVTGPPFDAVGFDWAYRDQDVAEASTLIEHAAERLVDLALDAGQVDIARDAVVRGLRGLPGNEELYRCRLRVEHHAGNLAGVTAAYEELVTYLTDLETEPSPATAALFQDLVRPAGRR